MGSGDASRRRRAHAGTETGDGVGAWAVLRGVEAYVAAWWAHVGTTGGVSPAAEPGPFPIRIQTAADLDADRFDLLRWSDPRKRDGPASPFWKQSGMVEAVLDPEADPLAAFVAANGGSIEGLRLVCGDLVLKVEYGDAVVQVLVRGTGPFPEDGGILVRHRFGFRIPLSVRRMLDFWTVADRSAPRGGRGRGRRVSIANW